MSEINLEGRMVCVVDDHPETQRVLADRLGRRGIRTVPIRSSRDLFAAIEQKQPDCILMDFTFASESGLFVQAEVQHRFLDAPPVIMLCEKGDQSNVIKAFRTGVSDCLMRSEIDTDEVIRSIRAALRRRDEARALRTELENLRRQSVYDEVHGFYRRESLEDMLARSLDCAPHLMKSRAVLLIRIDQFTEFAQQAGQVAARRLNRAFATRLRDTLRRTDFCGRFDPATFIYVVDTGTTRAAIEALKVRLVEALRFPLELETIRIGVSATIATAFYPEDATDVKGLMAFAEQQFSTDLADDAPKADDGARALRTKEAIRTGDQRASVRHRVFKRGKIVSRQGSTVIDCGVRDLSDGGARLRLDDTYAVPSHFDLAIGSCQLRPVRRVWQHSCEIGIAFVDRDQAAAAGQRDALVD